MANIYIAEPINQMTRENLIETNCDICFEKLFVPSEEYPNPQPVQITNCQHRFHLMCLQKNCENNRINQNTLINCACPNCRRRFNFNSGIQNLTQEITDRLAALDAETAQAQQIVTPPRFPSRPPPLPPISEQQLQTGIECLRDLVNTYGIGIHNRGQLPPNEAQSYILGPINNLRSLSEPERRDLLQKWEESRDSISGNNWTSIPWTEAGHITRGNRLSHARTQTPFIGNLISAMTQAYDYLQQYQYAGDNELREKILAIINCFISIIQRPRRGGKQNKKSKKKYKKQKSKKKSKRYMRL